jgi:hypothetical protein
MQAYYAVPLRANSAKLLTNMNVPHSWALLEEHGITPYCPISAPTKNRRAYQPP